MARWNDGIVTDQAPRQRFRREATPVWLTTACLLLGHRAPSLSRSFRYADLGCGAGFTAIMVAAVCPHADIWGFDVNPACIEAAQALADRAGLANAHFRAMPFADIATMAEAPFDFMIADDVYHVVGPEVRRDLVTAIGRHLRPGGLAYLGYRTNTGAPDLVPIQTAMHMLYESGPLVSDAAIPGILDHLDQLRAGGAGYFQRNPGLGQHLARLRRRDPRDLADEFLNRGWDPPMFPEIAEAMGEVRCDFIGRATLQENIPSTSVPPEMLPLLDEAPTGRIREVMQDIAAGTHHRRDIFRRGTAAMPVMEHHAALAEIAIRGLGQDTLTFPSWPGQVSADPAAYGPLREALPHGPLTVAHARTLGPFADGSIEDAADAVAMMIAAGYAHPVMPGAIAGQSIASARALNRAIAASVRNGDETSHLASPVLGTAIPANALEILAVDGLAEGHDADSLVTAILAGSRLYDNGMDEMAVREGVSRFLEHRVPLFRAIGVL